MYADIGWVGVLYIVMFALILLNVWCAAHDHNMHDVLGWLVAFLLGIAHLATTLGIL